MNKRGQGTLLTSWIIIELVLLIILWYALFHYVGDVEDEDIFEKSYVVRDLALAAESVQSIPGDVTFYYYQDYFHLWDYDFYFEDNEVGISEPNDPVYRVTYPYYLSEVYYTILPTLQTPQQLVIVKDDNWFEVLEYADISFFEKLECSETPSLFFDKETLVIDAQGDEFSMLLEYYLKRKLGFTKTDITRTTEEPNYDVIEQSTNLLIGISLSAQESEKTQVSAYIPSANKEQNEKLACLILNSILTYFPDVEVSTPKEFDNEIFNTNTAGLALQLVFTNPQEDALDFAAAIEQGIEEYYSS